MAFRLPPALALVALPFAALDCGRRVESGATERGAPRSAGSHVETASSAAPAPESTPPPSAHPTPAAEVEAPDDARVESSPFALDELNDVGPAGPATAHETGIVMVTRRDELAIARRRDGKGAKQPPVIAPVSGDPADFLAVARGPALFGAHAYWISRGRLVRRRLDGGGALEVLAEGARDGTRVAAAPLDGGKPAVAFIARPLKSDDPSRAKLWTESGTRDVCSEGSGASSVTLSRSAKSLLALFIDGRSGMTPVHARSVHAEPSGPRLGPDVVVWVTGPAQSSTEITATGSAQGHWAFIPMERDVTHFGLAQIELGHEPRMDVPVTWRSYPNGLDLAPVSAAEICGTTTVLYVRPSGEAPGSAQSLHLAAFGPDGPGGSEIVASARGFANVSLAGLPGGAILAYVADRRTWARTLRCKAASNRPDRPRPPVRAH